ncbi:unnamed protein product [Urochloa decumbens]|uniref:DUF4408 domain-containing protein n=1 Tax=Urochloa decumbens TaxID=240449 RepID=A0ABC9EB46_9POAL
MLEEAFPALWSAVHGFFTPAVLFVVLNIVIGTIAVTSKVTASPAAGEGESAAAAGAGAGAGGGEEQQQQYRRLSRVPSMAFERLRSFNLNRFAAPEPEPAVSGEVDLGYERPPAPAAEKEEEEEPVVVGEPEPEPEMEPEPVSAHAHAHAHVERSLSEAAAEPELPRLPARLHKSASDRSAFAHFEAEEVEEAVEARRPATTREGARGGRRRGLPVAEPDSSDSEPEEEDAEDAAGHGGGGGEVDALADAFINKFRNELKLQRLESFIRHRETVRRGQASAAGV